MSGFHGEVIILVATRTCAYQQIILAGSDVGDGYAELAISNA